MGQGCCRPAEPEAGRAAGRRQRALPDGREPLQPPEVHRDAPHEPPALLATSTTTTTVDSGGAAAAASAATFRGGYQSAGGDAPPLIAKSDVAVLEALAARLVRDDAAVPGFERACVRVAKDVVASGAAPFDSHLAPRVLRDTRALADVPSSTPPTPTATEQRAAARARTEESTAAAARAPRSPSRRLLDAGHESVSDLAADALDAMMRECEHGMVPLTADAISRASNVGGGAGGGGGGVGGSGGGELALAVRAVRAACWRALENETRAALERSRLEIMRSAFDVKVTPGGSTGGGAAPTVASQPSSRAPAVAVIRRRDPAAVGLGADFSFDRASGLWWSDEARLYFCDANGSFFDPVSELWHNSATGEWVAELPARDAVAAAKQQRANVDASRESSAAAPASTSEVTPSPASLVAQTQPPAASATTSQPHVARTPASSVDPPATGGAGDAPAPEWSFVASVGYWWSDAAQLYYDNASGSFGDPATNLWFDPATGRWT
jgi:hypothetical protein